MYVLAIVLIVVGLLLFGVAALIPKSSSMYSPVTFDPMSAVCVIVGGCFVLIGGTVAVVRFFTGP